MSQTVAAPTPAMNSLSLDHLAIETIRFLSADMVQAANSGHPGMPLGAAPMAWALWSRHLRHDPTDPSWADRDRFVLSAGHGSALLYALLHLFGYDLPIDELRQFRQFGSRTPGHPEYGHTPGVETTTGPLGQGLAMAVGLALAERMEAARQPGQTNHFTYAIVGDGCLMEGISHEAASFAGHHRLAKLIVLWDNNDITIDGTVATSCSDDQLARFTALGWDVAEVSDGNDVDAIDAAIARAKLTDRPSFISVRTVIGDGAPDAAGTPAAHGSPLGADQLNRMREAASWPGEFHVPEPVQAHCRELATRGAAVHLEWQRSASPATVTDLDLSVLDAVDLSSKATRQTSQDALTRLVAANDRLVGGSADLAGSTGTKTGARVVTADDAAGSAIFFGIREFAMAAIMNGIAVHGGFRVFGSTFLVFSDYLRPALRLAALMKQPVVHILTHDSVAVGEDGPTHQPIEHIESLRLIPGVQVLRPADAAETVEAWRRALRYTSGPTALILSRQSLPTIDRAQLDTEPGAKVELVATGSEVSIALDVAQRLRSTGIATRVVSALDRDDYQPDRGASTVSIEAGVTSGWRGLVDLAIGIDEFGASAPGDVVLRERGITADAIHDRVLDLINNNDKEATDAR